MGKTFHSFKCCLGLCAASMWDILQEGADWQGRTLDVTTSGFEWGREILRSSTTDRIHRNCKDPVSVNVSWRKINAQR